MNLFNCYQALVIFTALPFGIEWLYEHDKQLLAIMLLVPWLVGFGFLGIAVNEQTK
jgi:hypothetical protein